MKKQIMLLGTLAGVVLALALVTMGCKDVTDSVSGGDITYEAVQVGGSSSTATSTGIKLSFSAALSGLTAGEINVDTDTGEAAKGALSGSGSVWTIALTGVATQGNVKVSITKSGIERAAKTVAVYKAAGTQGDITYTAVANGTASATTSTSIALTFSAAVTGLTSGDITVADATGAAAKGALSGSGTAWSIALTGVTTQGNVSVSISKTGVESGTKTVAVYKAGAPEDITYTAAANGAAGVTTSTSIALTFSAAVTGLSADDITVADATGAATKGGALSGSGTSWSIALDSVTTQGNVSVSISKSGIESGVKTVAVYKESGGSGGGSGSLQIDGIPSGGAQMVYVFNSGVDIATYSAITAAITAQSYQAVGASVTDDAGFALYSWDGSTQAGVFEGTGTFPVLLLDSGGSITDSANPMYRWASVSFTGGAGTASYSSFTPIVAGSIAIAGLPSEGMWSVTVFTSGTDIATYAKAVAAATSPDIQAMGVSLGAPANVFLLMEQNGTTPTSNFFSASGTFPVLLTNVLGSATNAANPQYSWVSVSFTNGVGAASYSGFTALLNTKTLTAGEAVNALAADTSASVTFTGALGLSLAAADFAVDNNASVTEVTVSGDTATVTVSFDVNTFAEATKTYIVSIASSSTKIKGSATVAITQEAVPALTGSVSITGTAQEGQTLTAVTTSLGGSGTVSYQWIQGTSTTVGTDSATYVPSAADVGQTIKVRVSRDGYGGTVESDPTTAIAAVAATLAPTYAALTGAAGTTALPTNAAAITEVKGGNTAVFAIASGAGTATINASTGELTLVDSGTITVSLSITTAAGVVTHEGTSASITVTKESGKMGLDGLPNTGVWAMYVFYSGTDISTYATITAAHLAQNYQAVGASTTDGSGFALYRWTGVATTDPDIFEGTGTFPVLLMDTGGSITDSTNPMYRWASVPFTHGVASLSFSGFTPIVAGNIAIAGLPSEGMWSVTVFTSGADIATYAKAVTAATSPDIQAMGVSLGAPANVFTLMEQNGTTPTSNFFSASGTFPVLLTNVLGSATNAANPQYSWASVSFTGGVGAASYSGFTALLNTTEVSIAINLVESAEDIAASGGETISKGSSGSFTISVSDSSRYRNFRWIADGATLAEQSGSSLAVNAADFAVGPHRITVIADKGGIPYSAEVVFTVTN